ncbi:MAG: acetoin utilization protein AcuC [Rhodospirillales bacterium]
MTSGRGAEAEAGCSPLLVASEIFRTSRHVHGHPLAIPRVSLCVDLCRALGWLPDDAYRESGEARVDELARFHTREYIAAVQRAERHQQLGDAERRRFNLGINGNPIYGEVFRRPATACGASLLAARLILKGGIVHNPAGGTHHGLPDRASGYCVFNDPVLAILALLDGGLERVFYLDLDAHFGDGVQFAFADVPRVFTLSIHEAGRWPMTRSADPFGTGPGSLYDRAGGAARNLPVPAGFNDSELDFLMNEAVMPLLIAFRPDAVVIQCGCDALADDPMTRLSLSNGAFFNAVRTVMDVAPRLLVLGGGGYNPWAVARCWAGIWGTLNGRPLPDRLPENGRELLTAVRWSHRWGRHPPTAWLDTLVDDPRPGPIGEDVRMAAAVARLP